MTTADVAELRRQMANALQGTVHHANEHRPKTPRLPDAGSRAAQEIAGQSALVGPWDDAPVETALAQAGMLFTVAEDHLLALADMLDPFSAWASLTVARAIIETSGRAWWLLDPDILPLERVARSLTEQLDNYRQQRAALGTIREAQRKRGCESPELEPMIQEIDKRMEEIAAFADTHGETCERDRRGRPVCIGARRPEGLRLAEQLMPGLGGVVWRYYSAATHGVEFGVMQALRTDDDTQGETQVKVGHIGQVTMAALRAYCESFHREAVFYDYDIQSWTAWAKHAIQTVNRALT